MSPRLDIAAEVRDALAGGGPVVALESSIIGQGMPFPHNRDTALAVAAIVRQGGAVPATIGIVAGCIKVGLDEADIEHLATAANVAKASARDIAALVAQGATGGTTVAATMRIAALAGIRVFATGGIGGVHRGWRDSLDISADLTELARRPVAVVSAGAKAILDIGATLEQLETLSVPVVVYGSDEFPAFYSRTSGHPAPARLDRVDDIARLMQVHWRLGGAGGIAIANPIPREAELPAAEIDRAIEAALLDMRALGIAGKATTPFLLARINEITAGRSLAANMALIRNNAELAAAIAVADAASIRSVRGNQPGSRPRNL